ncbi:NfeD family protein [Clostridium algidicarnis]|uniref:NfeD family protein n=1 Tax=Clostridium algidicarnis TaxID=37659 RepID=UPI001C0D4E3B|nr:NfeD family protein [Clostridium algidicarnis]MBU3227250.1 NfeD family protein [Clostridium algidicarnis]MBU3250774.1 NfeD family protein [Clostridium algidicarnis]
MEKVFYYCFLIGIIYSVLSVILGGIFDIFNIGGSIDLNFEFPFISLMRPAVLAVFSTVFGGVGLIGIRNGWKYTILIATVLGICSAIFIWRFVIVNLLKAENTSSVKRKDLIGSEAFVIETILEGKVGSITYVANGNKYSSPARCIRATKISVGEKVIIEEIKENTFFVMTFEVQNQSK